MTKPAALVIGIPKGRILLPSVSLTFFFTLKVEKRRSWLLGLAVSFSLSVDGSERQQLIVVTSHQPTLSAREFKW